MPGKDELEFLHKFEKVRNLVRAGKIKGIQLRLDEKPGQTIANRKGVNR